MSKIKFIIFMSMVVVLIAQTPVSAFTPAPPLPGIEGPGGVPHYFGPYGNWAFSPLPMGPIAKVKVLDGGTGYNNPIVTISDAYITPTTPANVTASVGPGGVITGFTIINGGTDYVAPVVIITDDPALCGGAGQPACGTGALADAVIGAATLGGSLNGGMRKFVDKLPGLGPAGENNLGQYIPVAVPETRTYSGQQADYYEIALVEYSERMHTDLPPTRLRGYVQLETPTNNAGSKHFPLTYPDGSPIYYPGTTTRVYAFDKPHYLGPLIIAKGRAHGVASPAGDSVPVRIKFYNFLPTGAGGNLFIPVDETVMGSGYGPALPGVAGSKYTQNRATIHLHGNNTVWISDGSPHQWITPANENTPYPKGVSVRNVPDMGADCDAPGSGCMTLFYTNAQSASCNFTTTIPMVLHA